MENSSLSDQCVEQVLCALSKKESFDYVLLTMKEITMTTAENLLKFIKDTQIGETVW